MRKLLLTVCLVFSISSIADITAGTYRLEMDWDRIKRGVTTGDFSCKGTCAIVSVDWKEVFNTITGKKYRALQKQRLNYCISEYQNTRNALINIHQLYESGDITDIEAEIMDEMVVNSVIDRVCIGHLGASETQELRRQITGLPDSQEILNAVAQE